MSLPRATFVVGADRPADHGTLGYAGRFPRRRFETGGGRAVLVDLPRSVSLDPGDGLQRDDGAVTGIRAAREAPPEMRARHPGLDAVPIEPGGDALSATFSPEPADVTVHAMDAAAGEEIPRTGGPAITRSDVPVVDKTDLGRL